MMLNIVSQHEAILSVLGYVGIPSLMGAAFWIYYQIKTNADSQKNIQESLTRALDRLDNVERVQSEHDKNLAMSVQKTELAIEDLKRSVQDMPDKIVSHLLKQGILSQK